MTMKPGSASHSASQEAVGGGGQQSQPMPLLTVTKLRELLSSVAGASEQMDPIVESALLRLADDFVADVAKAASELAMHRRSEALEPRDLLAVLQEEPFAVDMSGYEETFQEEPAHQQGGRRKSARSGAAAAQSAHPAPVQNDPHAIRMAQVRRATGRY